MSKIENSPIKEEQVKKATEALLKHLKSKNEKNKPNLLEENNENVENIYLVVNSKKFFANSKSFKPLKISLKHPLYEFSKCSTCLFVKDPEEDYKEKILEENSELKGTIEKIVGVSKLKGKYKTFESRRALRDSYEIFFADDRVITLLPKLLGKSFLSYNRTPISIKVINNKNEISNQVIKNEIKKAFNSTYVYLSPGTCLTIKIGKSSFPLNDLIDNINSVISVLPTTLIKDGWDCLQSIHIKSTNSTSLPIYLSDSNYIDSQIESSKESSNESPKKETLKKKVSDEKSSTEKTTNKKEIPKEKSKSDKKLISNGSIKTNKSPSKPINEKKRVLRDDKKLSSGDKESKKKRRK